MTDVYKLVADIACSSIKEDWKYITIEIKSSMWEMFNTTPFYYLESGEKKSFALLDDDLDIDLGENVFELQEAMYPNHKWNKAVYTLEKNGRFDMEFEWDQSLQDEWEKS